METAPAWSDTSPLRVNAWVVGREALAASFAPIMMALRALSPTIQRSLPAQNAITLSTTSHRHEMHPLHSIQMLVLLESHSL